MFFAISIAMFSTIKGIRNIKKAKFSCEDLTIFADTKVTIPLKKEGIFFDITFNGNEKLVYIFKERGYQKIKNIDLVSTYPLGLTIISKKFEFDKKFLIYPKLKGQSLKKSFFGKSENVDFDSLKPYEFESLKYIHWPSVAKGEIQSKKFSGEAKTNKLTFSYNKLFGDKEKRISQLALWAYEAYELGIDFIIELESEVIESKKGFHEVFKKLALY